jgi:Raf kinase inhibitor-like YbhB/YbcL family protein
MRPPIALSAAFLLLITGSLAAACGEGDPPLRPGETRAAATDEETFEGGIEVTSEAFSPGGGIPERFTCDGANVSPPLSWSGAPEQTESFAIIADDPDAPGAVFSHWVIFNLPPDVQALPEGVPLGGEPSPGGRQGRNGFGHTGYGGPCPPKGETHRYHFTVYALDGALDVEPGASRDEVFQALEGRILDQGRLTGRYGR